MQTVYLHKVFVAGCTGAKLILKSEAVTALCPKGILFKINQDWEDRNPVIIFLFWAKFPLNSMAAHFHLVWIIFVGLTLKKESVPCRKRIQYCRTTALCLVFCTVSGQSLINAFTVTYLIADSLHAGFAVPWGLLVCPLCPPLPTPHNSTSHFHLALKTSFALLEDSFVQKWWHASTFDTFQHFSLVYMLPK